MDLSNFTDTELLRELSLLKTRKTGRTTRLVDEYIQELFNNRGEWVEIRDHYDSIMADDLLTRRIIARLRNEHNITKSDCEFNGNRMRILPIECDFSMHKYEIEQIEQEIERRTQKNS